MKAKQTIIASFSILAIFGSVAPVKAQNSSFYTAQIQNSSAVQKRLFRRNKAKKNMEMLMKAHEASMNKANGDINQDIVSKVKQKSKSMSSEMITRTQVRPITRRAKHKAIKYTSSIKPQPKYVDYHLSSLAHAYSGAYKCPTVWHRATQFTYCNMGGINYYVNVGPWTPLVNYRDSSGLMVLSFNDNSKPETSTPQVQTINVVNNYNVYYPHHQYSSSY